MQGHCMLLQGMSPYAPSLFLDLPNFGGSFVVVVVVGLKDQPNLAFMNFIDHSNETLNEPLKNSRALNSRSLG